MFLARFLVGGWDTVVAIRCYEVIVIVKLNDRWVEDAQRSFPSFECCAVWIRTFDREN